MTVRDIMLRQPDDVPTDDGGWIRRGWERLRDLCDVVQDSWGFQHLTTTMIVLNSLILAINWRVYAQS